MTHTETNAPTLVGEPGWDTTIQELLAEKNFAKALVAAEAIRSDHSDHPAPYLLLADVYWKAGEPRRAADNFVAAIKCNPDQTKRIYQNALILYYEQGDIINAQACGERALARFPNDATVLAYYGLTVHRLKDDGTGIDLMRRGLAFDPNLFGTFYRDFGPAMQGAGQTAAAITDLRNAISELKLRSPLLPATASAQLCLAKLLHAEKQYECLRTLLTEFLDARADLAHLVEDMLIDAYGTRLAEHGPEPTVLRNAETAIRKQITDLLLGESRPAEPTLDGISRKVSLAYCVTRGLRYIRATAMSEQDQESLIKAGISPAFIEIVREGAASVAAATAQKDSAGPWHTDPTVSTRVKDILDTVASGAKRILSPFSGTIGYSNHMVSPECFLFRESGMACLIVQWSETDTPTADTVWVFPDQGIVLYEPEIKFDETVLGRRISAVFDRLLSKASEYRSHFSVPASAIAVSEFLCPHIGHYIWNCVSGWSPFFRYGGGKSVDFYAVYSAGKILGSVAELFPEEVSNAPGGVIEFNDESDAVEFILSQRVLLLTIKDKHVPEDLAQRVIKWSYEQCSEEFLAKTRELRSTSNPLVLITIRLDNRCWIEQETGWPGLLRSLARDFPGIAVVIDGINRGTVQGWTHALMSVAAEERVCSEIVAKCGNDLPILNSIGCTIAESIVLAHLADCFIAPVGAGMAKYRWIANLPGVAFSNRAFSSPDSFDGRLYDHFRDDAQKAVHVDQAKVTDVDVRYGQKTRANFTMNWQDLYEVTRPFLDKLVNH